MRYYVNLNEQPNGDHEVHEAPCSRLPLPENRLFVGDFSRCAPAVAAAKQYFTTANGCAHCSPGCNTG